MSFETQATTSIYVDDTQAEQALRELTNAVDKYAKKMNEARKANDKAGFDKAKKEWGAAKKEANEYKRTVVDVTKVLNNLSGTSYNNLMKVQRKLERQLRGLNKNTKEEIALYKLKTEQLKKVKAETTKVRLEMAAGSKSAQSWMSRLASGFNKYSMVAAGFIASITGMIFSFRKAIDVANDFNASVSNLSAMTGLTGKKLEWLTQKAKDFAGSTTKEGIRITQTAKEITDGYILMGSARPELLKNKEALAQTTEQAIILATAQKMDLNEAVNAVAASMNQFNLKAKDSGRIINSLAAGSLKGSAFVQDLTDSLKNVGTVADGSNMSLEQTIAMLEILAKKQLKGEEAGTQMRSALLRLKAAQLGYQSGTFNLGDALDEMNKKMKGLHSQVNKDAYLMKVFGKRQITAGSIMLQNVDAYKQMTKAVTDTNTATEQASKNTDNDKARLDAARAALNKVTIELGEKLAPAITFSTSAFSHLIRGTLTIIKFFKEYKGTIISLAAGIAAYTVVVNAAAIKQAIYTTATRIATLVTRGFNTAVKSNPLGLFIGLIVTAATALITWKGHTKDATDQQADFNTELEKTGKLLGSQIYGDILDSLFGKDFEGSAIDRLDKINKILKKKALALSKTQLEAVQQYLQEQIADMNRILANVPNMDKDLQATTLEIYKPSLESMKKSLSIINTELDKYNATTKGLNNDSLGAAIDKITIKLNKLRKARLALLPTDKKGLEANQKEIAQLVKLKKHLTDIRDIVNKNKDIDHKKEDYDKLLQLLDNANNSELEKIKQQYLNKELSDEEYQQKTEALTLATLMAKRALMKEFGIDTNNIDQQILDFKIRLMKEEVKKNKEKEAQKTADDKKAQKQRESDAAKEKAKQIKHKQESLKIYQDMQAAANNAIQAAVEGNENALKQGAKAMIFIMLDMLKAQTEMAIAGATIQSLVQPDSIATFGTSGLIRAAIIITLIEGAFAAVKGLVGLAFKDKPATVAQHAAGNFADVIGKDDGQTYHAALTSGGTGLYKSPSIVPGLGLVGEKAPELVFSGADTQKILNTPALVEAIKATIVGVPQFAAGNSTEIFRENNTVQTFTDPLLLELLQKLNTKLEEPAKAILMADEDYIRTHEQVKQEYDEFQKNIS